MNAETAGLTAVSETLTKLCCVSDELLAEKERYKAISDELDQTFAELAGY